MKTEPVAAAAVLQTALGAVLGLLAAFNVWNPSQDQLTAVFAVYVALVPVLALVVRRRVTPTAASTGV